MTKPAIANPLGFLLKPIIEKINPNIHKIPFKTGTHEKIAALNARINPVIPEVFFCFRLLRPYLNYFCCLFSL